MIKGFKKGSYKMSARAALGCLVAAAVVFTNGVSVSALDTSKLSETSSIQSTNQTNSSFLIDAKIKNYLSIDVDKASKIAGFKFKVPDYVIDGNTPAGCTIEKVSDTSNSVEMEFNGEDGDKNAFAIFMIKDNPSESLKEINENKIHNEYDDLLSNSIDDNKTKVDEHEMKIEDIVGKNIEIAVTTPEDDLGKEKILETKYYTKYFVWENSGVYYAIQYNSGEENESEHIDYTNISQDEIGKIAKSLKDVNDIKNLDYHKNSSIVWSIYDKEDLQKAAKMIGFGPKMPLKINNNVRLSEAHVDPTRDSFEEGKVLHIDENSKDINYQLQLSYKNGDQNIMFTQSKHDTFDRIKQIKENGYFEIDNNKVDVEKTDIDGKTIYRYKDSFKMNNDKERNSVCYEWEENGIYYSVLINNAKEYQDDIVKGFINSKSIN